MISPEFFYNELKSKGVGFYAGVPDSLLKSFCAYLTDNANADEHIIAANEGCAVGMAAGYHLATGNIPVVYMQNSGLGNTVNPLLSLIDEDVYSIPLVLIVGWRGEPGIHDEPQHKKQGKVTCKLLESMGIPYSILSFDEGECKEQIDTCISYVNEKNAAYALIVRKDVFSKYVLNKKNVREGNMGREAAIDSIVKALPENSIVVSTTGMASRELFEIRERDGFPHNKDFLTVGCMGHASQIALGIALNCKEKKVVCIDGDGALIMHMGGITSIGTKKPKNYIHIVIDNGVHDSVGGQPNVSREIDLLKIADAVGYSKVVRVKNINELSDAMKGEGPIFVDVVVTPGARSDLGRPTIGPVDNKKEFMNYVQNKSLIL